MSYEMPRLDRNAAEQFADFLIERVKKRDYDQYGEERQELKMLKKAQELQYGEGHPDAVVRYAHELALEQELAQRRVQIPEDKELILRENIVNFLLGTDRDPPIAQPGDDFHISYGGEYRLYDIFDKSGIDVDGKDIFGFDGHIGIRSSRKDDGWEMYVKYWNNGDKIDVFPVKERTEPHPIDHAASTNEGRTK